MTDTAQPLTRARQVGYFLDGLTPTLGYAAYVAALWPYGPDGWAPKLGLMVLGFAAAGAVVTAMILLHTWAAGTPGGVLARIDSYFDELATPGHRGDVWIGRGIATGLLAAAVTAVVVGLAGWLW